MTTTPERGARIGCLDCSDPGSLVSECGRGCETCGQTGYLIIEAVEVP